MLNSPAQEVVPLTRSLLGLTLGLCLVPAHAALISEVEGNNNFATAQSLDGNFSSDAVTHIFNSTTVPHASVAGAIGPTGGNNDVDYYGFTVATPGSTGYFDIDDADGVPGGLNDSVVSLFDSGFNLLGFSDDSGQDPGSPGSFDSFLGAYTFGSAGLYYLAVSSVANFSLSSGNFISFLTRPDGGYGGNAFAANSGPTSVNTTGGGFTGTYTLHASLTPPAVAAVPEPGMLRLLGMGLLGGLAARRRGG